jgi:hypothetical protein
VAHLDINPEKGQLFQKEVWYMEHTMSPEGVIRHQEDKSRMGMADTKEQAQTKEPPEPAYLLQMVYLWIC